MPTLRTPFRRPVRSSTGNFPRRRQRLPTLMQLSSDYSFGLACIVEVFESQQHAGVSALSPTAIHSEIAGSSASSPPRFGIRPSSTLIVVGLGLRPRISGLPILTTPLPNFATTRASGGRRYCTCSPRRNLPPPVPDGVYSSHCADAVLLLIRQRLSPMMHPAAASQVAGVEPQTGPYADRYDVVHLDSCSADDLFLKTVFAQRMLPDVPGSQPAPPRIVSPLGRRGSPGVRRAPRRAPMLIAEPISHGAVAA